MMRGKFKVRKLLASLFEKLPPSPAGSLPDSPVEAEIKLMYARGDLDRRAYLRLLELAQQGIIYREDLPQIQDRLEKLDSDCHQIVTKDSHS